MELDNAGVIQGFDFVLSFLLDGFLRGQCLSNKLSILLKKSWNDRFGFPEGIWRVLFQSMFSISFSKASGSKLWNDLFSFLFLWAVPRLAEIEWGGQRLKLLYFLRWYCWRYYYRIYYLKGFLKWALFL